jgi:zinc transport system substrate-binding protein
MKRIDNIAIRIIILIICFPLIQGCQNAGRKSEKRMITVSILPQKYFIEKIAGDKFQVNVMVPPGANHENYDPTPEQVMNLSNTFLYFRIGNIEFENVWIPKFVENYPELKIVNLSRGLNLISNTEDNEHDHQNHHHGQSDPHTWMSPVNVKGIAKNIYEALVEQDMENEGFYTTNYKLFIAELDSLNDRIAELLQHKKSDGFIIYHPALTYFARDFGLKQYALEVDGKSPSAFHIRAIIDIAKKENIRVILVQKQFDKTKAETIATETGAAVTEIDPLNENWAQEIMDITNKLAESLNQ